MRFELYRILRTRLRLKFFFKYIFYIIILRYIRTNSFINQEQKMKSVYKFRLSQRIRSKASTRIVCAQSGRSKAVQRTFSLSRFRFRDWTNFGYITGMGRHSW